MGWNRIASEWRGRIFVVFLLTAASPVLAADVTSTWTGGSGNWSGASNWSTNPNVPNNGADQYTVLIDGNQPGTASSVSVDIDVTIDELSIDAGDSIDVESGQTLMLVQPTFLQTCLTNAGTITLSGELFVDGNICLATNTGLIEVNSGGLLRATLAIINTGTTVRVNAGGEARGGITNGTLEIVGAGEARIAPSSVSLINSSTGLFQFGEDGVAQGGGTGTLSNPAGGLVVVEGDGLANSVLTLNGPSVNTNAGRIELRSGTGATATQGTATLGANLGTVTLAGGGIVRMVGFAQIAPSAGFEFINADNLITGAGDITSAVGLGAVLTNQAAGLIDANSPSAPLHVSLPDGGFNNAGTLRASGGGSLIVREGVLSAKDMTNSGTIQAQSGSTVTLTDAAVIDNAGGTIEALDGGTVLLDGLTSIENGRLASSGSGVITATGNIWILRGTVENDARINASINPSFLRVGTGDVTLEGDGVVEMASGIVGEAAGDRLTNGAEHTLDGAGVGTAALNTPLTNLGLVTGNVSFSLVPTPHENAGVVRSDSGDTIFLFTDVTGDGIWIADGGKIAMTGGGLGVPSPSGDLLIRNSGEFEIGPEIPAFPSPVSTVHFRTLSMGTTGTLDIQHGEVSLSRHLSFAVTDPNAFVWNGSEGAKLILEGGVGATTADFNDWAQLEVAGEDLGTDPVNHVGAPAGFTNNFQISHLTVDADAHVWLVDLLDNGNRGGIGGTPEALYVDTLEFADSNGRLNLDGLHLYYNTLIGNVSQIIDVAAADPAQCNDGQDNDGDGAIDFHDDSGCTGPASPVEGSLWVFWGTAQGGTIDFNVNGVALQVTTTAGQTAAQVAAAVAAEINADVTLSGMGVTATSDGNEVVTNGDVTGTVITDPGLYHGVPTIPAFPYTN